MKTAQLINSIPRIRAWLSHVSFQLDLSCYFNSTNLRVGLHILAAVTVGALQMDEVLASGGATTPKQPANQAIPPPAHSSGTASKPVKPNQPARTPLQEKKKWIAGVTASYSSTRYAPSLGELLKPIANASSAHFPLALEINFLTKITPQGTCVGGSIGSIFDAYWAQGMRLVILNSFLSGGVTHFFDGALGRGLFLRGEAGLAAIRAQTILSSGESLSDTEWGLGVQLNGGFAVPVGDMKSLLLSVGGSSRYVKGTGGTSHSLLIGAGFMF